MMAFESYFKPFHLVTQNLFQNQTLNSCKIPGFAFLFARIYKPKWNQCGFQRR